MNVLVTGASGFIGGHTVAVLQQVGHDVTAFVRRTSDTTYLNSIEARLAYGDVTDAGSLRDACRGQDWVIHTAAVVSSYGSWKEIRAVGVDGTQNMLDAAAANDVSRFVHLSSIAVYGTRAPGGPLRESTPYDLKPERWNHYVREKVWSERRVWRTHDRGELQVTSLRPSVVLGPRDRAAVPRVLAILRSPTGAIVGDGTNRIPCVVVEDLAAATVAAVTSDAAIGRAYNISGQAPITQREMMDAFADAAELPRLKRAFPEWVAMTTATVGENVSRLLRRRQEPAVNRLTISLGGRDFEIDSSRAATELGWEGTADYFDAIRRSVEYELQP